MMMTLPGLAKSKQVIGRVEEVSFPDLKMAFEARIDTGARTCSLHVVNEKVTQEGKEKYIEFDTEDRNGKKFHIKSRVYRTANVRSTNGEVSTRYVIREKVTLGGVTRLVNITLNDRTELRYNFLVGRNFLRGKFLVDVSLSHTRQK